MTSSLNKLGWLLLRVMTCAKLLAGLQGECTADMPYVIPAGMTPQEWIALAFGACGPPHLGAWPQPYWATGPARASWAPSPAQPLSRTWLLVLGGLPLRGHRW